MVRALLVIAALLAPSAALACSVCGCGDPLVMAGNAQPAAGNLRFALDFNYLTATAASDELPDATEGLAQLTLRPSVVYSPSQNLNLVVMVPLLQKRWSMADESARSYGIGDLEIGARWFLWNGIDFAHQRRQHFALTAGAGLPTGAIDAVDGAGVRLDDHAQVGTGGFGPYVGALYAFHQDPWNASLSVTGQAHTPNAYGLSYGPALRWSLSGQYRVVDPFAFTLGLDGRYAGRDSHHDALMPNTGGLVLALTPGAVVKLYGNLWLHASVQLPVFTHLFGQQTVGPVYTASLQYSLR